MNHLLPFSASPDRLLVDQEKSIASTEKQSYNECYFRMRYLDILQKVVGAWSRAKIESGEQCCYKISRSQPDFNLKRMDQRYLQERIIYFTEKGLEEKQVFPINGLLYNADLSLYNSSSNIDERSGSGEMIVMDRLGSLFIALKRRGIFHHSSFFSGKPVAFAGLCFIKEGKIEQLVSYSGHYSPGKEEENSFIKQIQDRALALSPIERPVSVDDQGHLIETIALSSKATTQDLHQSIAKICQFAPHRLRLISEGQCISSQGHKSLAQSPLKNGSTIWALESVPSPDYRISPKYQFRLLFSDE